MKSIKLISTLILLSFITGFSQASEKNRIARYNKKFNKFQHNIPRLKLYRNQIDKRIKRLKHLSATDKESLIELETKFSAAIDISQELLKLSGGSIAKLTKQAQIHEGNTKKLALERDTKIEAAQKKLDDQKKLVESAKKSGTPKEISEAEQNYSTAENNLNKLKQSYNEEIVNTQILTSANQVSEKLQNQAHDALCEPDRNSVIEAFRLILLNRISSIPVKWVTYNRTEKSINTDKDGNMIVNEAQITARKTVTTDKAYLRETNITFQNVILFIPEPYRADMTSDVQTWISKSKEQETETRQDEGKWNKIGYKTLSQIVEILNTKGFHELVY